jgi:hypothetical protein
MDKAGSTGRQSHRPAAPSAPHTAGRLPRSLPWQDAVRAVTDARPRPRKRRTSATLVLVGNEVENPAAMPGPCRQLSRATIPLTTAFQLSRG